MRVPERLNMKETKEFLLNLIKEDIEKDGMFSISTVPDHSSWNKKEHFAMEQIQRNPPEGLHVSRGYKYEVYDWTVVEG